MIRKPDHPTMIPKERFQAREVEEERADEAADHRREAAREAF